jgi:hypothetical protein
MQRQRILDHGYILPMVTSRGPLCTAGFVRGTTRFHDRPGGESRGRAQADRPVHARGHRLAQGAAQGDGRHGGGIFILDDIVGFINEEHYLEFAHPYLKRICDAFPADWVKLYHNDAEVDACLDHLPDAGFNVLNWGKQTRHSRGEAARGRSHVPDGQREPAGNRRSRHARGSARGHARRAGRSGGEGIILSVGGGTSPGMPRENIVAMLEALQEFNASRGVVRHRGGARHG